MHRLDSQHKRQLLEHLRDLYRIANSPNFLPEEQQVLSTRITALIYKISKLQTEGKRKD